MRAIGQARRAAAWLGIEASQLGDLREARADYSHELDIVRAIRTCPGGLGRASGGGTQWRWPDGTWRKRRPVVKKSASADSWSCTRTYLTPAPTFLGLAA